MDSLRTNLREEQTLNDALAKQLGQTASLELQTRFLCGLQQPWFTKVKARSMAGFGQLEQVPYTEVRGWLAGA